LGVFENYEEKSENPIIQLIPEPLLLQEKGKMKSSLFLKRGTEGELEIEICRTLKK